jgi:hypothetical protein
MTHSKLEDARMSKFNIGIDNSGVVCSPKGGHFRGHKDDRIVWESTRDHPFTLHFALTIGKGTQNWPFTGPPQPVSQRTTFEGTLAPVQDPDNPPAYKYTVVVEGYAPLDPIIIVDK